MAKKQTFLDKTNKLDVSKHCPVCDSTIQRIQHVKAVKGDRGAWKFRTLNVGVCQCNEKEIYV